jgi:IS5 family transposase
VDAESGTVHTVRGSSADVADVVEANSLLQGEETVAFGDAGYDGVEKRPDAPKDVKWYTAMRHGKRRALDATKGCTPLIEKAEKITASIRAKVEHPFRVIKRQFGHVKARYRGLAKNTAQLKTPFAPSISMASRLKTCEQHVAPEETTKGVEVYHAVRGVIQTFPRSQEH